MALPATCRLPLDYVAQFPERCVVCLESNPNATRRLIYRNHGKARRLWAGWFQVTVPCCPACGLRLFGQKLVHVLSLYVVVIVSMGGTAYVLWRWLGLQDLLLGLCSFGVMAVSVLALQIWQLNHPPSFDVTVGDRTVEYEFRDAGYAAEFAALNSDSPEGTELREGARGVRGAPEMLSDW